MKILFLLLFTNSVFASTYVYKVQDFIKNREYHCKKVVKKTAIDCIEQKNKEYYMFVELFKNYKVTYTKKL